MAKEYKSLKFIELCDIYFEKISEDVYTINEDELLKLIKRHDYEIRFMEGANKKLEAQLKLQTQYKLHYKNLAHTYKVELGRCRRKLTRIYKALDDVEINMVKEFLLRYDTAIVLRLMELIKSIKKLLKSI